MFDDLLKGVCMKTNIVKIRVAALSCEAIARVRRNGASFLRFVRGKLSPSNLYAALILAGYAGAAAAQSVSDNSAPWDGALCGVAGWFKGSTPIAVGTIAFAAAGLGFLFGEELTGILKKVVNIVMAICLVVGGAAFVGWIATKLGAGSSACSV
jgi:type IV secretion system protein VirB2